MPKNKDLKRLVRSRMQKTGESYTTARARLIARRAPTAKDEAAPPADLAALGGMKDETVLGRTGRTWAQWVRALDALGCASMGHGEIAELVHTRFEQSGWWSQMVTVGYERIHGRRTRNQLASGVFAVSKNRTFAVPIEALARAFAPGARAQWLAAAPAKERKTTRKVARWVEADGSWVDVSLVPKGAAKSTASVQHTRIASRADVEARRAMWAERLEALGAWLAAR